MDVHSKSTVWCLVDAIAQFGQASRSNGSGRKHKCWEGALMQRSFWQPVGIAFALLLMSFQYAAATDQTIHTGGTWNGVEWEGEFELQEGEALVGSISLPNHPEIGLHRRLLSDHDVSAHDEKDGTI
jgi:hypothetical protein